MTAHSPAERRRRRYKPADVRVLFIGESPPAGGTFFYYANSNLYNATRAAFAAAIPVLGRRDDFLDAFKWLGCYLEDLALESVNHLPLRDPARLAARRAGILPSPAASSGWSRARSSSWMEAIGPDAADALELAGLADVPRERLPFPARPYNQYVEQLTEP